MLLDAFPSTSPILFFAGKSKKYIHFANAIHNILDNRVLMIPKYQ